MPDATPKPDHAVKPETAAETMDEKIGELPPKPVSDGDAESVAGGAIDAFIWFEKPASADWMRSRVP